MSCPRSGFRRAFAVVRALRDRFAPGLPLWVTETGWRAAAGPDEPLQAAVLVGILRTMEDMPQHDVRMLLFHTLVGDLRAPGGADYGVVELGPGGRCARARPTVRWPVRSPDRVAAAWSARASA